MHSILVTGLSNIFGRCALYFYISVYKNINYEVLRKYTRVCNNNTRYGKETHLGFRIFLVINQINYIRHFFHASLQINRICQRDGTQSLYCLHGVELGKCLRFSSLLNGFLNRVRFNEEKGTKHFFGQLFLF